MDNKTIDRSLEAQLASIHEAQTKSGTVNADDVQQFIVRAKSLPNWYFLSWSRFNIPFIHEGKAYAFTNEQFAERASCTMLDAHFRWKCKNIRFTTGLCLKCSSGMEPKPFLSIRARLAFR